VERRLFGHVGTASETLPESESLLARAHCGTLVLDELTALGAAQQAKLLSVIREGVFHTVRGTDPIHSDVRLITTMTRDPKRAVEEGFLREDLYYRVAVVLIRVPPLRERREDIPLLIDFFLRRFSRTHGRRFSGVVPEVLARMIQRPWLGNIRELEGLLAAACDRAQGEMLTEQDLSPTYQRAIR
jgi:DNA-binding NtrC family response regulator